MLPGYRTLHCHLSKHNIYYQGALKEVKCLEPATHKKSVQEFFKKGLNIVVDESVTFL